MNRLKKVAILSMLMISSLASANPRIIPGAPRELTGPSLRVIEAVLQHADLLDDALRYGHVVTDVAVLQAIESTQYLIGFGSCTIDPAFICTTRAILTIDRGYLPGQGLFSRASVSEVDADYRIQGALTDTTDSLIQALAHVAHESQELSRHGNRLQQASTQFISPSLSRFRVSVQACSNFDGARACLGGATLQIDARTVRHGMLHRTTYTARFTPHRD